MEFTLFCLTWLLHNYTLIRLHWVFNADYLHARFSALVLILPIQVNCCKSSKIFLNLIFYLCTWIFSSNCDVFISALTIQKYPRISTWYMLCLFQIQRLYWLTFLLAVVTHNHLQNWNCLHLPCLIALCQFSQLTQQRHFIDELKTSRPSLKHESGIWIRKLWPINIVGGRGGPLWNIMPKDYFCYHITIVHRGLSLI